MIAYVSLGWLAISFLGLPLLLLAARICRRIRVRYQGRRLVRYCQLYLLGEQMRAALDANYEPRKEM